MMQLIITVILLILFSILTVSMWDLKTNSYMVGLIVGAISFAVMYGIMMPKYITIEKSSDNEWIKSDKNYNDTTITEIKILNKKDTVYPTTIYKRIKL